MRIALTVAQAASAAAVSAAASTAAVSAAAWVAAVSMAASGLVVAPPVSAEPTYVCPPACNRIPGAAWIDPAAVPLDARYAWQPLAGLAVTSAAPRFRFEELCGNPAAAADPRGYSVAEHVVITNPAGQWQLQAQILHWRGETWRGGQLALDAVAGAAAALRACQQTNPAASPSLTLDEPDRLAAVISGPVIVHQYLLADPVSSTVTELALWSTAPPATPYPTISDTAVLEALAAPLCSAYLGSCQ